MNLSYLRVVRRRLAIDLTEQPDTKKTYRNAVSILLTDTLSFSLALLEGVLVLELGTHVDDEVDEVGEGLSKCGGGWSGAWIWC